MEQEDRKRPATLAVGNDQSSITTGQPLLAKRTKTDAAYGPETWTDATSPFVVIAHYREDGVTDKQIEFILEKYKITSLSELEGDIALFGSVIRRRTSDSMLDNITAALNRSMKPTAILGGQLEFDDSCLSQKMLDLFSPEAVSVIESGPLVTVKENCDQDLVVDSINENCHTSQDRFSIFTLVMGPSGSGKTMFCLNGLPTRVFPDADFAKDIFRVHLRARALLGTGEADVDLQALLVDHVRLVVKRRLSNCASCTMLPIAIDLILYVIIDEAGRTVYKRYFDDAAKIIHLVNGLKNMEHYKFSNVHVTVTGTALEASTQTIDSVVDTVKYRMQPWSSNNFRALLGNMKRTDKNALFTMVERFPILRSLRTNARCAFYLATSMVDLTLVTEQQWADQVKAAVAKVALKYIKSSGLAHVTSLGDKFTVAQQAFKALNEAMRDPTAAVFPSFGHIDDATLRSAIQSLLDVNVETKNGKPKLMKGSYSVSMSPAITIVLAESLCQKARVSWNWQRWESTAALGEWKKLITDMDAGDFTSACGINYLSKPIPFESAKFRFSLPLAGKTAVFLNGPRASYADVIAPFRLLQAKFSVDVNTDLPFDFTAELGKMGLTNGRGKRLNQAVTSALYKMWQQKLPAGSDRDKGQFESLDCYNDTTGLVEESPEALRCEHYPYETLLSGYTPVRKMASFIIRNPQAKDRKSWEPGDINKVLPHENDVEAKKLIESVNEKQIMILEEFTEELPVTAVFVTNVKSLILKDGTTSHITISREDVDWQGVPTTPLPAALVRGLRKHVEVRFMFYR